MTTLSLIELGLRDHADLAHLGDDHRQRRPGGVGARNSGFGEGQGTPRGRKQGPKTGPARLRPGTGLLQEGQRRRELNSRPFEVFDRGRQRWP